MRVKWHKCAVGGALDRCSDTSRYPQFLDELRRLVASSSRAADRCRRNTGPALNSSLALQVGTLWFLGFNKSEKLFGVERGAQNSDGEMGEVRGFVVELNPTDDAMLLQIIRYFRFADFEMFREARSERTAGLRATAAHSAEKLAYAYTKGLARLDVVRGHQIGI